MVQTAFIDTYSQIYTSVLYPKQDVGCHRRVVLDTQMVQGCIKKVYRKDISYFAAGFCEEDYCAAPA